VPPFPRFARLAESGGCFTFDSVDGAQHIYRQSIWNFDCALALSEKQMARATWDWEGRIGRRVKLRDIHVLSAVVRSGSMAKAAITLAMSQSAVSEAIAGLEDALRVKLLDRSPQGIQPTIYADVLLKRGNVVFDELSQAIKDIEFLTKPTVGEVRVASQEFFIAGLLPAVIERLSARYPQIAVRVIEMDTQTPDYRELHERQADLALYRVSTPHKDDEIAFEILFDDPNFVVAGARSRWVRRRNIKLADLVGEPWVLPPSLAVQTVLEKAFGAAGLKLPTPTVSASSILLRRKLLATGRYLSVLATSLLKANAKDWKIKALPIALPKPPPVAVFTLRNRTLSPVAQLFIEQLRAVAKTM
jgi:DNA-binding transcriptional LysR family regulator